MAVSVAPLTTTVIGSVEDRCAGTASGINNAISRIAGMLAVALVGAFAVGTFGFALDPRLTELHCLRHPTCIEGGGVEARRTAGAFAGSRRAAVGPQAGTGGVGRLPRNCAQPGVLEMLDPRHTESAVEAQNELGA
jgi:hypothetical protein